jgi:dTDP-4-dehydrorhamnose reductase
MATGPMRDTTDLVIGASGFIGRRVFSALVAQGKRPIGTCHTQNDPQFKFFDLQTSSITEFGLSTTNAGTLIFSAGIANTASCESQPEHTWEINVTQTLRTFREAADIGMKVVFLSSDYIVSADTSRGYTPNTYVPALNYGKQKLAVEEALPKITHDYVIARPAKVFSLNAADESFLTQLCKKIYSNIHQKIIVDQYFRPIHIDDLSRAIVGLATPGSSTGVFNITGEHLISRAELALLACRNLGISPSCVEFILRADLGMDEYPRHILFNNDFPFESRISIFDGLSEICSAMVNS